MVLKTREVSFNPIWGIRDGIQALAYHWKEGDMNWPTAFYLALVNVVAAYSLLIIHQAKWQTFLLAYLLWPLSGVGITGGCHRLWAHRAFEAHWIVKTYLMLAASTANQGSIYHWARDHRVHHKHSETDGDPHNAQRGFFFAHMGWLFVKKHKDVVKAGRELDFSDLSQDPYVMFQKRLDPWFSLFCCFAMPALLAQWGWGEKLSVGFLIPGVLRYVIVLHFTWMVNSAAHIFGDHPYDTDAWPAENPLVSLAACGEGWHSYHHAYPFDYATSECGVSVQYNPTKLFIDTLAQLGLVKNRKRATGAWEKRKERRDRDEIKVATALSKKNH